jgi:hypothetical protein
MKAPITPSDHEIGRHIPSGEQMMKIKMMVMVMKVKCSDLKKEERETKWDQGKSDIHRAILFW